MKTFMNLDLGLPYRDPGARPELKIVMSHSGEYMPGDIPAGVVFLTIGMDLQEGKQRYENPDDGPRLEMEVLGHGEGYRTWQILYRKFYGAVDNPDMGAWAAFYKWCIDADPEINKLAGGMNFVRKDGMIFHVCCVFIDSGDLADTVYRFCAQYPDFTACKGDKWTTEEKLKEKGDIAGPSNMMHYRKSKITGGQQDLVLVVGNYYKDALYGRLKIEHRPQDPQAGGYCSFPQRIFPKMKDEADKEYYEQLNAEERRRDRSFHKVRNRNEALDVRVYAMAAGEYHVMERLKEMKEAAIRDGIRRDFVDQMTPAWLISHWAQQLSIGAKK
jgi:phage terminase large subunit GpA-like protein